MHSAEGIECVEVFLFLEVCLQYLINLNLNYGGDGGGAGSGAWWFW